MSSFRFLALTCFAAASTFLLVCAMLAGPRSADGGMTASDWNRPAARLAIAPADPGDDRLTQPEYSASASVTILPDLSPESAPVPPEPKLLSPQIAPPDFAIAQAPLAGRATAAAARLKSSLTPEMLANFGLFIFVSKAARGPLAQRMYVFRKDRGGLILLYDWPVSTGREKGEISPRGRGSFTATPAGFYQLDPARMYPRYRSWNWDQDMPWAMFFNWERQGRKTGLAIHSAVGDDIARLGARASAGCVHLSPEHAEELYRLIRGGYRGDVPRFAFDARTRTMSNQGGFMHRPDGGLRMTQGYRVLIDIDDYAGKDVLAMKSLSLNVVPGERR